MQSPQDTPLQCHLTLPTALDAPSLPPFLGICSNMPFRFFSPSSTPIRFLYLSLKTPPKYVAPPHPTLFLDFWTCTNRDLYKLQTCTKPDSSSLPPVFPLQRCWGPAPSPYCLPTDLLPLGGPLDFTLCLTALLLVLLTIRVLNLQIC